MIENIARLTAQINYQFKDSALLEAALSHRSVGNQNYERLEFLGDAILNCVIAAELFRRYRKAKEGELSRLRASLVNGEMLAVLAKEFNLGDYLKLGIGELKSGGFLRKSILADSMEAIIGAIYLDSDFNHCEQAILKWFAPYLEKITSSKIPKDFKTRLQELLQAKKLPLPTYTVLAIEGEAHHQIFRVKCSVEPHLEDTEGQGDNRRAAEQQAAERMLTKIQK